MKKTLLSVLLVFCVIFAFMLAACGNARGGGLSEVPPSDSEEQPESPSQPEIPTEPTVNESNILIVYFSATNNTERVASYIAELTNGTAFEIVPVDPYTSADLNYSDPDSRVSVEHLDESLRDVESVSTAVDNWASYGTVFIGYPIWWGIAAWPVNNFIKNNDFTGKTVIPFATSASSGLGQSGTLLAEMAGTGNWLAGERFSSSASQSTVKMWLNEIGFAV